MGVKGREKERVQTHGLRGEVRRGKRETRGIRAPAWSLSSREALKLFDQVSPPSEWCFHKHFDPVQKVDSISILLQ